MTIAYDNSLSVDAGVASSNTLSYGAAGANLIMVVGILMKDSGSQTVSSITYNGTNLTSIPGATVANGARHNEMWYMLNPAQGTHNLITTLTGVPSNGFDVFVATYTGAKQSGQPDASGKNSASAVSTLSVTLTTVLDNCWIVMMESAENGGAPSAGANTFLRSAGVFTNNELILYDTNGNQTPAGSHTVTGNTAGNSTIPTMMAISISPALGGAVSGYRSLLGVGI